jgi:hypothetical protein
MMDILRTIHLNGETLESVDTYSYFLDCVGICLNFSSHSLFISVDEDDIPIISSEKPKGFEGAKNRVTEGYWLKAYNKPILFCWTLIGDHGYLDGLQIEFARDVNDESITLQIIAMPASLSIRKVVPTEPPMRKKS